MARTRAPKGKSDMGSAIAAATVGFLMTGAGSTSFPAEAAIAPEERAGAVKFYRIDEIPLTEALTAFADQNDLRLSYDARLTRGVRTRGLSGAFTTQDALRALLDGTALTYKFADNGRSVLITLAQADNGVRNDAGAEALPPIDVGAEHSVAEPGRAGGAGKGDPKAYRVPDATTATKTNTPIMETPISIQVVPQQVLQDQQATSLARAVDNVSGVRSYNSTYIGVNDQFQLRGFSNGNTYVDGLKTLIGVPGTSTMSNVERVEVLKGPASILYGRAEPGGIVNIVTKKPQETPHAMVEQLFGSWDSYRTAFDATGPLVKDGSVLYRLTGEIDHHHSFRPFNEARNYWVSPVVQWKIDAATQITVDFQYGHQTNPVRHRNYRIHEI